MLLLSRREKTAAERGSGIRGVRGKRGHLDVGKGEMGAERGKIKPTEQMCENKKTEQGRARSDRRGCGLGEDGSLMETGGVSHCSGK